MYPISGIRTSKKAMSQTIWIVVAVVIALATAMIILAMMTKTTGRVSNTAEDTTDSAGDAIKENMCRASCKTCLRVYGDDCPSQWSSTSTENGCSEILPDCS